MTMKGELLDRDDVDIDYRPEGRRLVRFAQHDRAGSAGAGAGHITTPARSPSASAARARYVQMSSRCRRSGSARGGRIRCVRSSPRPPASTSTATSARRRWHLPRDGSVLRRVAPTSWRWSCRRTVDGGIVLNGKLLDGATGNAGHVGHTVVEPNGRRCSCGSRGCLEAEASGPAIEAITGRPHSEPTYEIMQRTGRLVGQAVATVCNLLDLDLAVVGGSIALGFGATFFNSAQETLDEHAQLSFSRSARITPARLGGRGPLIGAGAVGLRGLHASRPAAELTGRRRKCNDKDSKQRLVGDRRPSQQWRWRRIRWRFRWRWLPDSR